MRTRTRQLVVYGTLTAAVAAAGTVAYTQVRGTAETPQTNTRTLTVQTGTVASTVSATGNLEPVTSTDVGFGAGGTITEVDVKIGDTVAVGAVLAKVDPAPSEKALTLAKLDLTDAYQNLSDAYSAASSTASSATGTGSGTGSGGTSATAVARAEIAVTEAEEKVAAAEQVVAATTVVAPAAGTVTAVNGAVGDTATASTATSSSSSASSASNPSSSSNAATAPATGASNANSAATSSSTSFVTIVDPSRYQVEVSFPESDAVKLAVGQTATVTVESVSGVRLQGTVSSIDATATVTNSVVTYGATVAVDDPPTSIKAGMSASVDVVTESKQGVVAVATAAVQSQGGQSYVNKLVNGQQERTAVEVGLQGDSTTEIVSGLVAGDQVVIATGSITSTSTGTGAGTGTGRTGSGTLTGGGTGGASGFPAGGPPTGGPR